MPPSADGTRHDPPPSSLLPLATGLACAAILVAGLADVAWQALRPPRPTPQAAAGRGHLQLANVTWIAGPAPEVGAAARRAAALDGAVPEPLPPDWRSAVLAAIHPQPTARHLVVLPGEGREAPAWSLPGAYWAAWAGTPVVFAGRDGISAAALETVRNWALPVRVLAPGRLVGDEALRELAALGPVERVAGDDLARHAVRLAEARDDAVGFGWGRDAAARGGAFAWVLAAPSEWRQGLAALPLAAAADAGFLFTGDDGGVPAATERYLWSQRPAWFADPVEPPFHRLWVVGPRLSYPALARLDLAVEKAPYPDLGSPALGPIEALLLPFVALGLAGGVLVGAHGRRLLPDVLPATRLAWALTAALVPVVGVVLYFAAYRRPRLDGRGGAGTARVARWLRPPSIQAAAATAMGFGYAAPLMIALAWILARRGLPLAFRGGWVDDGLYFAGAGMPRLLLAMFVGASLLAWLLVQRPIARAAARARDDGREAGDGSGRLGVTLLVTTVVSLGMMTAAWWLLVEKAPRAPRADELLWFELVWVAASIGFLVAWPLHWPLVRARVRPGAL